MAQGRLNQLGERGRSSMVERQLPKLHTRVRFPSPAPRLLAVSCIAVATFGEESVISVREKDRLIRQKSAAELNGKLGVLSLPSAID